MYLEKNGLKMGLGIHVLNLPSQSSKIWQLGNNSKLKTSSKCWLPRSSVYIF